MSISVGRSTLPSGGVNTYRNINVGTGGSIIATTAGAIYYYYIRNDAGTVRYVKIYDKVSAATNTDTPMLTIGIPATAAANAYVDVGIKFTSGAGIRCTTAIADNDNSAPSANDVSVNIGWR